MQNGEKQSPSLLSKAGAAAKEGAKQLGNALKKKILLLIAPALPYIFMIAFVAFAGICIYYCFTSMFSLFTGRDAYMNEEVAEENANSAGSVVYEDINNNDIIPGQEQADKYVETYDEPGTGLDAVDQCDPNLGLFAWLGEAFSGNFANACSLINYIQSAAVDKENSYRPDIITLDRGLLVSTFYYAYVYRHDDETSETGTSGDPITIMNYMISKAPSDSDSDIQGVKINKADIKNMYDHQVVKKDFLKLTWGVVRTETEEVDGEEVTKSYYGCKSERVQGYEYDTNKYRLFLRDKRDEIIGGVRSVTPVGPSMDAYGYVGAKNYSYSVTNSTGFCLAGEPNLGENEYLATENGSDYVTMSEAQAYIKDIIDNKKNDYSVFLTKADYEKQEADDLSFVYNGSTYNIDYEQGYINEKFSYFSTDYQAESAKEKKIEMLIDIVFNNAGHMNDSLNFPYTPEYEILDASNTAIVIGEEAAPLGDYQWVVSSAFGEIRSFGWYSGPRPHKGIDMAGGGVDGVAIYAWKPGKVIVSGYNTSCGNWVQIQHESLDNKKVVSWYCHMKQTPLVHVGDEVAAGTLIGYVGATGLVTGAHLHFQINVDDVAVDPCNYITVGHTCTPGERG